MKTSAQTDPIELHATIKLGIDADAKWFSIARPLDVATPHPILTMTFDGLLRFVAKQQRLAREAFGGDEAAGFSIHRVGSSPFLIPSTPLSPQTRGRRGFDRIHG